MSKFNGFLEYALSSALGAQVKLEDIKSVTGLLSYRTSTGSSYHGGYCSFHLKNGVDVDFILPHAYGYGSADAELLDYFYVRDEARDYLRDIVKIEDYGYNTLKEMKRLQAYARMMGYTDLDKILHDYLKIANK